MLDAINNKELGIKEILSIALNLFKMNFKSIMIVVSAIFFPISILSEILLDRIGNSLAMIDDVVDISFFTQTIASFFQNYVLLMMVMLFLVPVGEVAIAKITKSYLCNEPIHMGHIIGEAMSCLWGVIITELIYIFFIFLVSLVVALPSTFLALQFVNVSHPVRVGLYFIINGIPVAYFLVIWVFHVYIIGLREIKGWKALVYSKNLIKNRFWKTAGYIVLTNLIVVGWGLLADRIFMLTQENNATSILSSTLAYILGSFTYIIITVLFMNRESILLGEKYYPIEKEFDSTIIDD